MRASIAFIIIFSLLLTSCGIIVPTQEPDDTEAAVTTEFSADTLPDPADTASGEPLVPVDTLAYSAQADAYLAQIAEKNYNFEDASFVIATPRSEVIEGQEQETTYSKAIHKRNEKLERTFNIHLLSNQIDEQSYFDQLNASILSDEYFADLLMIMESGIGVFAASDTLMNMRSLPLLDLSQPYFNQSSVAAATAGHSTYGVAGPASLEESSLSCVYFNRGLFEENGVEVPYKHVYSGDWTWDKYFASAASVAGINAYAAAHGIDLFSSYSTQYMEELLPMAIYHSCDSRLVDSVPDASPYVRFSEEDAAITDIIYKLYSDTARHKETDSGVSRFYSGKSLYMFNRLYLMSWMPNGQQNWGILPFPKLDSQQKNYCTLADESALFFAVQKNAVETERISIILSALNASSYGTLTQAYVDYAVNHLLRDNDSANMLEIILFSATYDFASAFSSSNASLASATTVALNDIAAGTPLKTVLQRVSAANRQLAARYPVVNR